jgi:hypothetical protein
MFWAADMNKTTIVLILFAFALTACGFFEAQADTQSTKKIAGATPVETDSSGKVFAQQGEAASTTKANTNAQALPAGAVIVFQRGGGFAGVAEQWVFFSDGRITNEKGDQKIVQADQVTALLDEFEAMGFFEMQISPGGGNFNTCKDCFTYQVTVTRGEKTNSITVQEGAAGVPEAFWTMINKLNSLAANP